MKQGGGKSFMGKKSWQTRWYVLTPRCLRYYKDRKGAHLGRRLCRSIQPNGVHSCPARRRRAVAAAAATVAAAVATRLGPGSGRCYRALPCLLAEHSTSLEQHSPHS